MMNKHLYLILIPIISFCHISVNCQLILEIRELTIGGVYDDGDFVGDYEGPGIEIFGELTNVSQEDVRHYSLDDSLNLVFYYEGEEYLEKLIMWPQGHHNKYEQALWLMKPGESFSFYSSSNLFYGTKLFKRRSNDYSELLIEVLPTLYFEYIPHYYPDWEFKNEKITNVELK